MQPNPALKALGFADNDRLAIIHTDDIGMCQASVAAFSDLAEAQVISCGATMVPCPWFPEAAAYCRTHPQVDMGVHLDLTAEWQHYRWGPISTREPASGLMDAEGFFYHTSEEAQTHAESQAAVVELKAQVEKALAFGVPISHVDTHMGTMAHPKFMQTYIQLALQYHVPAMIFRLDEAAWRASGMDAEMAAMAAHMVQQLEGMGMPLLDGMTALPLEDASNRLEVAKHFFNQLGPGITHFIIHPSQDTPELRAITPDWQARVADYQTFCKPELKAFFKETGIHVIGYKDLKALMPA